MAIKGKITINDVHHLQVDADPSVSSVAAPIASIASFNDAGTGRMFLKSGASDTSWTQVGATTVPLTSTTVTVPKNNDTDWTPCTFSTLTWQGFTTVTHTLLCRRDGNELVMSGSITPAAPNGSVVLMPLPNNFGTINLRTNGTYPVGRYYRSAAAVSHGGAINAQTGTDNTFLRFGSSQTFGAASVGPMDAAVGTSTVGSGEVFGFEARIPIAGWEASETEDKTIPLTSAILQTESDGYLRIAGFTPVVASTATKIFTLTSGSIQKNIGSALQYLDDSVNGARFIAQRTGNFTFTVTLDANTAGAFGVGFSVNASSLTIDQNALPIDQRLDAAFDTGGSNIAHLATTAYLNIGDIVRIHHNGGTISSPNSAYSMFTAQYEGKIKIINPSSDQKIDVPTHEVKFEGASSRGSVDTGVVRFNTLSKIKGDGIEVLNTTANGTVLTMKKAGKLEFSASLTRAASSTFSATLNQTLLTDLTAVPAEILATCTLDTVGSRGNVAGSVIVKVGDKIRISFNADPTSDNYNTFSAILQEQSVQVALSNVLPQFTQSDSVVQLNTANGYGSTNTKIRRFSNLTNNFGTAISYTDSATLGASFGILEDGDYHISYTDEFNTADYMGLSLNTIAPATAIQNITSSEVLAMTVTQLSNNPNTVAWSGPLLKNDVIRAHASAPTGTTASRTKFTITKIGKPNLTSVDVTPFANIKTTDTECIVFNNAPVTTTNLTSVRSNTNSGILSLNYTTGVITVLKKCHFIANTSCLVATTTNRVFAQIKVNGLVKSQDTNDNVANNQPASATWSEVVEAGTTIELSIAGLTDSSTGSITAIAQSDSIVTPVQNVSSETMNFVFKTTAIVDADPDGTFNTYTYSSGSNTAAINTSAPTQTTASMNTNGIQVFARAYNVASTSASPARVDVKVGKNLDARQLNAYMGLAKSAPLSYDIQYINGTNFAGTAHSYDPVKGILTLSAGVDGGGNSVTRYAGVQVDAVPAPNFATSAYFMFKASTANLVNIPNLQLRTAYLSDVRTSGTSGGGAVAGATQTRTLNTLVDNTGILTSLVANQFTLPAGTYRITGQAPSLSTNSHRAKIRNITDSTYPVQLLGTSTFASATGVAMSNSFVDGEITITSPKVFEFHHFTNATRASDGLGVVSGSADVEIYATLSITKIK